MVHIRKALSKKRGNQFYKDRSERKSETLCGAEPSEHDCTLSSARASGNKEWFKSKWGICEKCFNLAGV